MGYLTPTVKHWAIDIETDDLNATVIWVACVKNVVTKEEHTLVGHEAIRRFIDGHPDVYWVTHNGLEFDIPTLNRLLGTNIQVTRAIDTFVLSMLYMPTLEGGHSLEEWAKRVGMEKIDYHDWSKYSEEMARYCLQDTRITAEVFLRLARRMLDIGFTEVGCSIEHRAWAIIRDQRRNGFAFDVRRAGLLFAEIREEQERLKEKIYERFPPVLTCIREYGSAFKRDGQPTANYLKHQARFPRVELTGHGGYRVFDWVEFNLGSPPQRVAKLIELGWKPREFTPETDKGGGGNPKATDGGELVPSLKEFVEESGIEEVRLIAQWMALQGRANAVGNWIDLYNDKTGCIHGNLWLASSLRYRHDKPNTANIPAVRVDKDEKPVLGIAGYYTYEARDLWTCRGRAGERRLVGVDAKGIQLRCLAHYLDDADFTAAILAADPHAANRDAWGFTPDASGRRLAKTILYAIVMGAGDGRISSEAGISIKEAKAAKKLLFDRVPGLPTLINRLKAEFKRTGRITLCDGSKVSMKRDYTVIPYLLQGDESRIMKLAMIYIDAGIRKENLDVLKVGDIHDEHQYDCLTTDVDRFIDLCRECFKRAGEFFKYKVPMDCDAKVGNTWAETH
jgi:DNA polymerase I-like protein with 3'-5' exonuclease and polymerase domains